MHTVRGMSGHVSDIAEANALLQGQKTLALGDAGYKGVLKRADALLEKAEKLKASVRAKAEHPFRVIKRQFGFMKVRYRDLKKNTAQLFTLSSLWMARGKLMGAGV